MNKNVYFHKQALNDIGENLYRNVFGKYDQKIFESGVNYFRK
jgi:hypothetical protein